MNSTTRAQLQDIFRVVLQLDDQADVTGLRQLNTPAWDSLVHVALVAAIENQFAVSLDVADQLRMTSFESVALLLEERGA